LRQGNSYIGVIDEPAQDFSDGAKVVYESKDGKTLKPFDALDWLAQLTTFIPNKGEQMDIVNVMADSIFCAAAENNTQLKLPAAPINRDLRFAATI